MDTCITALLLLNNVQINEIKTLFWRHISKYLVNRDAEELQMPIEVSYRLKMSQILVVKCNLHEIKLSLTISSAFQSLSKPANVLFRVSNPDGDANFQSVPIKKPI